MKAFLDTHIAVKLFDGRVEELSSKARSTLDDAALFYSAVVRLEIGYLHQIERTRDPAGSICAALWTDYGVRESDESLATVVDIALGLTWTRDPFDRLIVATAMLHHAPLVTADARMLEHYERAVW